MSAVKLEGSCHCGAVRFSMQSNTPMPYQRCYCSICRKTAGGGGYAINIMGWADSLEVVGAEHIATYHAKTESGISPVERNFCARCGSALWIYHDKWPDLVHPFASAIDSELPVPREHVHMMLEFKAGWIDLPQGDAHVRFDRYPDKSIEVWHESQQGESEE